MPARAADGATVPAKAGELLKWCRQHLAGCKCPRYLVFAEITKPSTGKILKFKLREMAKGGDTPFIPGRRALE
jgi:acyl-CoA synthetase (AMP-forming)/AMP-acid ligase II